MKKGQRGKGTEQEKKETEGRLDADCADFTERTERKDTKEEERVRGLFYIWAMVSMPRRDSPSFRVRAVRLQRARRLARMGSLALRTGQEP